MYFLDPGAPLAQGDIFPEFPSIFLRGSNYLLISEPTAEGNINLEGDQPGPWRDREGRIITNRNIVASSVKKRVIILSQTCDLQRRERAGENNDASLGAKSFVLYCPLIPIEDLEEKGNRLDPIRKNSTVYLHWLPEYRENGIDLPESVVCFPLVSCILKAADPALTFDLTTRLASLESPFREKLANRFAYYISRVTGWLAYPVGSLHEEGAPVQESGEYVCTACERGQQTFVTRARFPRGHCAQARWRFLQPGQ